MSKQIIGDLTTLKRGVIIHQVNCQNAFGSGFAKSLATKWPYVKEEYHKIASAHKPKDLLYNQHICATEPNLPVFVVHSFSQLYYGNGAKNGTNYTTYAALISNIKKSAKIAEKHGLELYMPKFIGCGLAGGDWNVVYNSVKDIPNLTIVEYQKNVQI